MTQISHFVTDSGNFIQGQRRMSDGFTLCVSNVLTLGVVVVTHARCTFCTLHNSQWFALGKKLVLRLEI